MFFDPKYKAVSDDDKAVFKEKQKFVYSVFEEKLKTDMGKFFVRLHEQDYNAQEIYRKLLDHAKASTQASIDTADLLSYITTIKLHESKWRGTTHSFILHWCDKVRTYEELVDQADHFTGNIKMIMLQNTVAGVAELHQVKTQSAHDVAHGKQPLSFDQYKTLLLSAASTYDSKRGLTRSKNNRTVHYAEVEDDTYPESDMGILHDIDTDFAHLEVHEARHTTGGPGF